MSTEDSLGAIVGDQRRAQLDRLGGFDDDGPVAISAIEQAHAARKQLQPFERRSAIAQRLAEVSQLIERADLAELDAERELR